MDVIRYGQDHWDSSRIEAEINQAADWAHRNGVPLVCNEFGVYRKAEPQDHIAWIKDVRTVLERHNIGWPCGITPAVSEWSRRRTARMFWMMTR